MGLQLGIKVKVFEDNIGKDNVGQYLNALATKWEIFLNGPESPGPCLRCLSLHGTVWRQNDSSKPRPQLHSHCYCRLMPYRKSGSNVKRVRTYQRHEYLRDQLRGLTQVERQKLMGKQVERLHRLGIVETEHLVSKTSGISTLKELAPRRLGIQGSDVAKFTERELIDIFDRRLEAVLINEQFIVSSTEALAQYKVTKSQTVLRAIYDKVMTFTSESGKIMLKRVNMTATQAKARINKARAAQKNKTTTKEKHFVPENNKYSESRRVFHDEIAESVISKGTKIAKGEQGEILMTGGFPGSGKSSVLNQAFPGWEKKYVHIDSDKIKDLLAIKDGLTKIGEHAALYQAEASDIIRRIMVKTRRRGYHVLYDGTMRESHKVVDVIKKFKRRKYKVELAFADLPLEKSIERAIGRFLDPRDGRFVDPAFVVSNGIGPKSSFEAAKSTVDKWVHYNTDVPWGQPAKLVAKSKPVPKPEITPKPKSVAKPKKSKTEKARLRTQRREAKEKALRNQAIAANRGLTIHGLTSGSEEEILIFE